MANQAKKISELTEKTSLNNNDTFAIVDSTTSTTKKVKAQTIANHISSMMPPPDLDAVLTAGNNGGGSTIENIANSTSPNGLVNKGYVDSTPRVFIQDLAWFQANANTVFAEGNIFYFKDSNHPRGTGVHKVADGVNTLANLPINVANYSVLGLTNVHENSHETFGNTIINTDGSIFSNQLFNGATIANVFVFNRPIKVTSVIIRVGSFSGSPSVEVKLFKLNTATNIFTQVASGTAIITTTGNVNINLSTHYDAEIGIYAIGAYTTSTTLYVNYFSFLNKRFFYNNLFLGTVYKIGNATGLVLGDFQYDFIYVLGCQFQNLI